MGWGFSRSKRSRLQIERRLHPPQLDAEVTQCVLDVERVEMHDEIFGELVVLDAHHQAARPGEIPELAGIIERVRRRFRRRRAQSLVELELAHAAAHGRLLEEVVARKRRLDGEPPQPFAQL